ncbi:AMP-binding protein [Mycolicibacterium holsaticum]|uniref:AMP-binding protein n=1 Tax=Mycolicibacterium holsaticum TaxID=152142 RepID=UPI001C7DFEA8|nr:AMP-binding protein [Mycolicibacterium holsaticum]MDA4110529.1 AMP-dependent synthetase [Mycolicibacterium holsaticum DSM 44478 = JCM 12374]QZA10906.1 AMP-binding protein [Mycolicibacterium holsaticum DSM 44478 = JCM 12374]UNC11595.1 AMP-binding protein [Mycolicibacterium holsaticum DSM 44478 = JCM 12374]
MTGRLVDFLRGHGDNLAVLTDTQHLTYAQLADRVAQAAPELGDARRLVLLETRNDIGTLVHYLAALAGGHVVLPVPAGRDHSTMVQTYDPDVVVAAAGVHHRRQSGRHRLHEDLALLLSTSGSTGSPKLVRLSHTNLISNATAIADYLDIHETDRAATTLPMSYCYGLSVIHSHLLRGAALILTDRSVVDDQFWELFNRCGGTSFAGVPYTFELLEHVGFDTMELPALRYVTQAGGRMPPERVKRFAELSQRRGWDLFVMYGATEAAARMAYLPPELALSRPTAIGRPIPGGSLTLEPLDDWSGEDVGQLVYRGDNVMMGYAHGPGELSLGKVVDTLHTGDVARRAPDGLFEVIGRTSRFVKIYGLRIDLQRLETTLSAHGVTAFCTCDDEHLVVAAAGRHDAHDVQRAVADAAGVPAASVRAVSVDELPLLSTGKPDYQTVRRLARDSVKQAGDTGLRELFADVLHLDPAAVDGDATFVDLGGNSLSYVAMSVRLERMLGRLPTDWHQRPLRELQTMARPVKRRRWWASTLETSVALRAVAIVLIVGSHAELFELWGGAHVLLGVAGYNFGRFCMTPVPRLDRVRHLRNTIGWIAVPSVLWVAVALVLTDDYTWTNLLLANKILGPHDSMTAGRLWFVEVLVWVLVALLLLFWLPGLDRLERQRPFGVAAAFLVAGLALRYDVLGVGLGREAWFTMLAFWFFAVGWAAAKASTTLQRAAVTAVLAVGLHGYFDSTLREALVLGGLVLLIWLPTIRCPAALTVLAGVLAEASLYTYLVHYQVYPLFGGQPLFGVVASLLVGMLLTYVLTLLRRRASVPKGTFGRQNASKSRQDVDLGASQGARPGRR